MNWYKSGAAAAVCLMGTSPVASAEWLRAEAESHLEMIMLKLVEQECTVERNANPAVYAPEELSSGMVRYQDLYASPEGKSRHEIVLDIDPKCYLYVYEALERSEEAGKLPGSDRQISSVASFSRADAGPTLLIDYPEAHEDFTPKNEK